MKQTNNLGLMLYDSADKMSITGSTNSLNHNMEIIDNEISEICKTIDVSEIKNDIGTLKSKTDLLNTSVNDIKKSSEY